MNAGQKIDVQISFRLPAFVLNGRRPQGGREDEMSFQVDQKKDDLRIALEGSVDALGLDESLAKLLRVPHARSHLTLDLTRARGLDHKGLHAVAGALERHCDGFESVEVRGIDHLPPEQRSLLRIKPPVEPEPTRDRSRNKKARIRGRGMSRLS